MRRLLEPLAIVIAVPVLATAFSLLARSDWEARWQASLVRQLAAQRMRPDARLIARYSLSSLCGDARSSARLVPCRTYRWHSSVIQASAVVGGSGFLFLGALMLASALCGQRLVRLFRPSLWFAAAGTAALSVANAALALAAVGAMTQYLFGSPADRVSLSTLLVTGTIAAVWGIAMAVSALGILRRPTLTLVGRRLVVPDQARFVEEMATTAAAAGAAPPAHVVACLSPSLFVTELKVACLDGELTGRTVCVSLPLLRILTVGEFKAWLVHELAHFAGAHAAYARHVAPFYTGAIRALDRLGRARGVAKAAAAPPRTLLRFFFEGLGDVSEVGADREAEADRQAATTVGAPELAAALVKVQAFGPAWYTVAGAMFDAVAGGTQYVNCSRLFEEVVRANTGAERLVGIGQQRQEHPTDRHPTLAERLAALAVDPSAVAHQALNTRPVPAAISLVADPERLEQLLSASEQQLIASTGFDTTALPV